MVRNSCWRRKPSSAVRVRLFQPEILNRLVGRHIVLQHDQIAGEARHVGEFDQVLAPLVLLDLRGAG